MPLYVGSMQLDLWFYINTVHSKETFLSLKGYYGLLKSVWIIKDSGNFYRWTKCLLNYVTRMTLVAKDKVLPFKVMGWVSSWQGVELWWLIVIVHWTRFRITMERFCEFSLRVFQERFKWRRKRPSHRSPGLNSKEEMNCHHYSIPLCFWLQKQCNPAASYFWKPDFSHQGKCILKQWA